MKKEVAVLLHDVRSTHNVGSIFRTADAAGVSKVYLSGYTPLPTDRFGRPRKDIAKTALGAETFLPWEYKKSPLIIMSALRKKGWNIIAVEQSPHSIDYRTFKLKKPTLFILGNEVAGITSNIIKKCDAVVEIPMHGKKESLNVSVAAGIILYAIR
jgi:tRNA G18 (ribose-2'-O)-methylase SpoU